MKKLLIGVTVLALILFSACGQAEPEVSSAPAPPEVSAEASEPPPEEPGRPVPSVVIPPEEPEGGEDLPEEPYPDEGPDTPLESVEPEGEPEESAATSPEAPAEIGRLNGEPVLALYSFDYGNRSYHRAPAADTAAILADLNALTPSERESGQGDVGFLAFTETGKQMVYLSAADDTGDTAKGRLSAASARVNGAAPHLIQWFCYMSPENIQSIRFGGVASIGAGATEPAVQVSVDTSDPDSIAAIARFLKAFAVSPGPGIATVEADRNNPTTTPDLYHLEIQFQNGVRYTAFGNEGFLSLSSSDMPEQITYRCDDNVLREFMKALPGATISTWP